MAGGGRPCRRGEHAGQFGRDVLRHGPGAGGFNYFNQALPIWREEGEQGGEALTLNSMGRAYADLGQKQNALEVL
jgi:hypothetical protein